jgi:CRISPR type III-A-associated protein Csm2
MSAYRRPQSYQRGRTPAPALGSQLKDYLDFLKRGYFDNEDNVKCELLTTMAEHVARVLGNAGMTSAQINRFFRHVRAIEREVDSKAFAEMIPRIQSLKPLVANYTGRGKDERERQRRQEFKRFVDFNVELAQKDIRSFKEGFVPHFESIVAYFKYHFPRK